MNKPPKISIIIPVYNCAEYIDETIFSAVNSSIKNIEIIIIDDGSIDNSYQQCLLWANKDFRIKLLKQTNQGVINTRNNAIQLAQAKYIFPLDADDKIHPLCLEKLLHIIETTNYDVVYPKVIFFGEKIGAPNYPLAIPEIMIQKNVVVCSALYKKTDWLKYQGYDKNFYYGYEDWDFWLNFIGDNKKFYQVNEAQFFYRIRNNSRNNTISKEQYQSIYSNIRKKHHIIFDTYYRKVKIINYLNKLLKIIKSPITLFLSHSAKKKWKHLIIPYCFKKD